MRTSRIFTLFALPFLSLTACAAGPTEDPAETDEGTAEAASALVATWTAVGGTTDVSPAPVSFAGKLFLFARGIGDSAVYMRSSTDGSTWGGWSSLSGKTTNVGLAPVVFANKLHVFAKGTSDNAIYVNTSTNGTSWSGWSVAFSGTTDVAVATAVHNSKLYVFSKGIGDDTLYVRSSTNGTSWTSWLGIPGTTDVTPAAVSFGGKLLLFSKGIGDDKIYLGTSTNGTTWIGEGAFDGTTGGQTEYPNVKKSTTATGVRAAVFADDLWVMNVDPDDHRIKATVTRDLTIWSGWYELPPRTQTTNAAVGLAAFGTALYFFAKGTSDNAIYEESTPVFKLPFSLVYGWEGGNNWDDVSPSHSGPGQAYAFDIDVDADLDGQKEAGAPIRAMRSGWVTGYFRDSNCNKPVTPSCDGSGNWVHIRHEDDTVASYNHMQLHTVPVFAPNQWVTQGDVIGLLGNTGDSSHPHVHVDVRQFEVTPGGFKGPTIPIYFEALDHTVTSFRPRKGDPLLSSQP